MTTHDAQHEPVSSTGTGYPTPAWRKAYRTGSRPDLRVPYREVQLTNGRTLPLYDTSGPYTDPAYEPDVRRGLPALRDAWISQRGDVEDYHGREARPEDDGLRHTAPRGGLANLDAVFPGRPRGAVCRRPSSSGRASRPW
jgi:phosphomethylpyrimidine synthase